jgi:hypothetical protein
MPRFQVLQLGDEQALLDFLPEVRRLAGLVECNDWHDDDPLAQSLRLFRWIQQLPASLREATDPPEAYIQFQLATLVDRLHGQYSAQELLAFAALIHDVGKAGTYREQPDGTTRCPDHEAASARLAPDFCARFGLTPTESDFVTTLVGAHGEPYELLKALQEQARDRARSRVSEEWQSTMAGLAARHGERFLPLLLLAWGDLVTSHLMHRRPAKYEGVLDFYQDLLSLALDGQ